MPTHLTRRQRLVAITASAGVLFVAGTAAVAWRVSARAPVYRPGDRVEGLTADLARDVPADHPRVTFTDVTHQAGIDFQHFSGTRTSQLPEDMGSGAAWGDYDDDGWEDLVVANESGPLDMSAADRSRAPARVTLYHNNHDGTFTDVTAKAGIDFRGMAMAVAWGDYDNDGRVDLLITAYGRNALYHNNGDGTFTDVSAPSGIGGPEGFWTGAAWGDYDRDGYLDLYITGYVQYTRDRGEPRGKYDVENPPSINPLSFKPQRNLLFRNNRDGTFTEVAKTLGVDDPEGRGLSAAWVDFDEDGWPDLYVGNDDSNNRLFHNLGHGRFEDISERARVLEYRSSMGIAVGDWNGDGYQDMFLTHWIAQGNALYDNVLGMAPPSTNRRKTPPLAFVDEADRFGLGQASLDFIGWATSFIDYDDDGKVDLFVVNGSTLQDRSDPKHLVPMRSRLYWNRGAEEGFYDVSSVSGDYFGHAYVGRGAAFADYDNDGDIDAFVVNNGGRGILLRNDGGNRNHWLQVKLRGTKSNRQGIGAEVRVVAGGVAQVRQIGSQAPYLSQNSLIETFGLGTLARADTIEVRWPSGLRQARTAVAANQRLIIVEGDTTVRGTPTLSERDRVQQFWTLYRQATSQRVAGQPRDAAETYGRALALDPNHGDVLYYYGNMRFALGEFAEAARAWRHLVTIDPHSGRAHSRLGALFSCLDVGTMLDLDSAEAHLTLADAAYREQTGTRLQLGEVALARGRSNEAERYFADVLRTNARSKRALFYAGYLAWQKGDSAAARALFAKSVAAMPAAATAGDNEGDTRSGEALGQQHERCDELRAATEEAGASGGREMNARYRRLQELLARYRSRSH